MNWTAFWSGLVGTILPGLGVSALLIYLSHRTNKALEKHKLELAQELAEYQNKLERNIVKFSQWNEKRSSALFDIYDAFREYLDFLRKVFYMGKTRGTDLTPLHDFGNTIDKLSVYLDDELYGKVKKYNKELLLFWNWAMEHANPDDLKSLKEVQHRLDFEIPEYLNKLRGDISGFISPNSLKSGQ